MIENSNASFTVIYDAPKLVDIRESPKTEAWRAALISAAALQLKDFAPVRFFLPGFIPEGVTLLVGRPKVGKSWLALDLCIAAADDNRFTLGSLKPASGPCLYLALEDNRRRLKKRQAKLIPEDWPWPESLQFATEWRRSNEGGVDDLRSWCNSVGKPALIVIDTLQKFRPVPKGQDSYASDYAAVTAVQELTKAFAGLCVVILHHDRKMEADDPFDTVSGTQGLTGAADTILILKRQAGTVRLFVRGRDVEESETVLRFDKHSCKWTMMSEADTEAVLSGERQAVLDALARFEPTSERDGMSVQEIMLATERDDRNAVDQLLYRMKEAGEIRRVRRGIYLSASDASKKSKKERNTTQPIVNTSETEFLTVLTDLTPTVVSRLEPVDDCPAGPGDSGDSAPLPLAEKGENGPGDDLDIPGFLDRRGGIKPS